MRRARIAATGILAAGLALSIAAAPLRAQPARNRFVLTLSAHDLSFKDDLARDLTLWHFDKAFFTPRPGRGAAWGIALGGLGRGGSWDVSYWRSARTADSADGPRKAVVQAFEITGRSFFFKAFPLHPYIQGGISLPLIHVDGGASFEGRALDADYSGAGLAAGAGLLLELGPRLVIQAGYVHRLLGFLYVRGEGKGRDINNLRTSYQGAELGRLLRSNVPGWTIGVGIVL